MTGVRDDAAAGELRSVLSAELDEAVVDVEEVADGLNLILAIATESDDQAYVLRRPNKLRHTGYLNELEREYAVMERLADTPIPVPEPVLYSDDESILEAPFFVMTALDGEVIPLGATLPARFQNPSARKRVATHLIDTLAEIHAVPTEPFADIVKHVDPREQVERSVERLDEAKPVTGRDNETLRSVADWLLENAPTDPTTTLLHGDFRPGNVLFAGTDDPTLTGVIDWETALLGEPLTELGYVLLRWRDDEDPTPSVAELAARYPNQDDAIDHLRTVNEDGLSPFTANAGSPTRRELVARYENVTGRSFEHDRFYRAHAAMMLATVWEDLHRHALEAGIESDWEPYIDYVASFGDRIVRGDVPL